MQATLGEVLTEEAFAHMIELATAFTEGVQATLDELDVPWSIAQLGARAEYRFTRPAPRTGEESAAGARRRDRRLHAPRHVQPRHPDDAVPQHGADVPRRPPAADVDRHTEVFREVVGALYA